MKCVFCDNKGEWDWVYRNYFDKFETESKRIMVSSNGYKYYFICICHNPVCQLEYKLIKEKTVGANQ